jgi:hypothetical protein
MIARRGVVAMDEQCAAKNAGWILGYGPRLDHETSSFIVLFRYGKGDPILLFA